MEGFDLELLNRMPLGEAVWTLYRYVANDDVLNGIFQKHKGRAYVRTLEFSTLVGLVHDALIVHHGSARQSFAEARENGCLLVTDPAAYGKLRRTPVAVSEALLAEVGARLRDVVPLGEPRVLPRCFAGYQPIHIDGKKLKQLAKRLKPLRGVTGSLLGGKVLVALDGRSGLAIAMSSALDGEANDAPLVPTLVPQVREQIAGPRLWVADRQFCDLTIPALLSEQGDAFVIRHSQKMKFYPDPSRESWESHDAQGRHIQEEWGWAGSPRDQRRIYIRRITLTRPGEESISVLTDLTDPVQFPAVDVLQLYAERWQIERVFQQVTEVFELQQLIGSSPEAAILQAALCLTFYNLIQIIRGYVAEANQVSPETVSVEMLFRDVQKELTCWTTLGSTPEPERVKLAPTEASALRERIRNLLKGRWSNRWIKSPPKKNWKPTSKTQHVKGGHSSAWKLLNKAKTRNTEQPEDNP